MVFKLGHCGEKILEFETSLDANAAGYFMTFQTIDRVIEMGQEQGLVIFSADLGRSIADFCRKHGNSYKIRIVQENRRCAKWYHTDDFQALLDFYLEQLDAAQ